MLKFELSRLKPPYGILSICGDSDELCTPVSKSLPERIIKTRHDSNEAGRISYLIKRQEGRLVDR